MKIIYLLVGGHKNRECGSSKVKRVFSNSGSGPVFRRLAFGRKSPFLDFAPVVPPYFAVLDIDILDCLKIIKHTHTSCFPACKDSPHDTHTRTTSVLVNH